MTLQAAGQVLIVIGLLAWLACWISLAFYGVLAAHRRHWLAALAAKTAAGVLAYAGITAIYQIPERFQ